MHQERLKTTALECTNVCTSDCGTSLIVICKAKLNFKLA